MEDNTDIKKAIQILDEFLEQLKDELHGTKVTISSSISAIFMANAGDLELIAFASGTGFPTYIEKNMDQNQTIKNLHSLVMVRRAFKRYLWSEVSKFYKSQNNDAKKNSIFEQSESHFKKLQVKDTINFFVVTTRVPCGDAKSKQGREVFY